MDDIADILKSKFDNIKKVGKNVPIIKAKCKEINIFVDISINQKGEKAANTIKNIISENPILKYVFIVLKNILKPCMNTFKGGISSFLLFHLIYYFYFVSEKSKNVLYYVNNFFNFYNDFEYKLYAIKVFDGSCYRVVKKHEEKKLSVISLLDEEECNVAARCYNYKKALECFDSILTEKLNGCFPQEILKFLNIN